MRYDNNSDDEFATIAAEEQYAHEEPYIEEPKKLKKSGTRETKLIGFDDSGNPIYRTTIQTVSDSIGRKKEGRYSTLYHATNHDEESDSVTTEKIIFDNHRNETVHSHTTAYKDLSLQSAWERTQKIKK